MYFFNETPRVRQVQKSVTEILPPPAKLAVHSTRLVSSSSNPRQVFESFFVSTLADPVSILY